MNKSTKTLTLAVALVLALAFTLSCSSNDGGGGGSEVVTSSDSEGGSEVVTSSDSNGGSEVVTSSDSNGGSEVVTSSDSNGGSEVGISSNSNGVSEGKYDVWFVKVPKVVNECKVYTQEETEKLIYNEVAEILLEIEKKTPAEILPALVGAGLDGDVNSIKTGLAIQFNNVDKFVVDAACYKDKDGNNYSVLIGQNLTIKSSSEIGSCSTQPQGISTITIKDSRDQTSYKAAKIGSQTWMAENLKYDATGSKCYGDSLSNCTKYGRLYNWATAMAIDSSCNNKSVSACGADISSKHKGICPQGWHIPKNAEWQELENFVNKEGCGGPTANKAGTKLKATSGWPDYNGKSGNGTDEFGFSALPGGHGGSDGSFTNVGEYGNWWSATEGSASTPNGRGMSYHNEDVSRSDYDKSLFFSVRCVQD
jgi:uncharacterized protein (TIGR02145 family)